VRFGVVVPTAQAIREDILAARGEELQAILRRLEGRIEFRLRGRYREEEVVRRVVETDRRAAQLRGSTTVDAQLDLGRRVVEAIERRRDQDLEAVLTRLDETVVAAEPQPVREPLDAFAISLLVDQDTSGFDAAVDDLGAHSAALLELELVGPMPPYSFVPADPWA
jgi:hypothetical protein